MFQFPPFASLPCVRIAGLQPAGLSHSEIAGSRDICSYPALIAAYHVLHRLREPRHPPCALRYFRHSYLYNIKTIAKERLILSAVDSLSNLQSCLCQYVKDLFQGKKQRKKIVHFSPFTFTLNGGEYRGRTDDLLHAMQAL